MAEEKGNLSYVEVQVINANLLYGSSYCLFTNFSVYKKLPIGNNRVPVLIGLVEQYFTHLTLFWIPFISLLGTLF